MRVGQGRYVRHESFYTTAAQVLPTLLIALVLEGTTIFRRFVELYSRGELIITVPHAEVGRPPQVAKGQGSDALWSDREFRGFATVFGGTVALFVLGELCALLVVFAGTDGWFVWPAAPITGLALLVMVIAVVGFPMVRVATETLPEMDDLSRVTAVDEETGERYGWLPQPGRPGERSYVWGRRPRD
jgi:hypothetical protein